MSFTGKVALVTGGASGMGRICALRLARLQAAATEFTNQTAGAL